MAKEWTNREIAKLLRFIAAAYTVKKGDRFKIVAYERAAASIEHATSEVKDLWDDGKLDEISGIGTGFASHLDELFRTGKVKHFDQVMAGLPPAMFEFLSIPGVGPKTAYKLSRALKIKNPKTAIQELEKAAKAGRIRVMEGFGEESEKDFLEGIGAFKRGQTKESRMLLPYADALAHEMVDYLEKCPAVMQVDPLGSLRRMVSTIGDIDLAVMTKKPKEVIDWFIKYPKIGRILGKGETALVRIILKNGRQIDIRLQSPEAYGAMLQYFTGGKNHNISLREWALKKGMSLSEHGIKKNGKLTQYRTEEDFYQAIGMDWIPPEIREDSGEIEAAQAHQLPHLVELQDIKGDLHIHSDFPIETSHDEGMGSMETLMEKAQKLGYEYLAFAEHNPSTSQHNVEQLINIIKRKNEKIDDLNYSREKSRHKGTKNLPFHLFNSLEIDIKSDGQLAMPEKVVTWLDFVIVSVHSNFRMSREEMTKRVLHALAHPKAKILGHPTGRKLNQREGYELDWEKILDFCLKNNKWLEINAWPDRLDLPDVLVREAVKRGVKMVINTDTHAPEHLDLMEYGVAVARRGWAEKSDIINTLSYNEFLQKLKT